MKASSRTPNLLLDFFALDFLGVALQGFGDYVFGAQAYRQR
jgi:hypothetical protein